MIRRSCILVASIALLSQFACGQMRIGLHGGVNLSDNLNADASVHTEMWLSRAYVFGGLTCDIALSSHWLIAAQVNYIRKGMVIPNMEWGLPLSGITELTGRYIEIPLCLRWRIGNDPVRWFAECGPAIAILESARARSVIRGGLWQFEEFTNEMNGAYARTELSAILGAGGEFNLTEALCLTLSVRYAHGLTEVFTQGWNHTRSQGVQIDCGLSYGIVN